MAIAAVQKHKSAIVWLYAPTEMDHLSDWSREIQECAEGTQIWIQVGYVTEAKLAVQLAQPDLLVVQGFDAGGHGLAQTASIVSLVPEVEDMLKDIERAEIPVLAAGGIMDARGVASALALGASRAVMGTRFLATEETGIPVGWQSEIIRADDIGLTTNRPTLCDLLKETKGWPPHYDGRAIRNRGHEDEEAGMSGHKNVALYKEELKQGDPAWGPHGRTLAYAGTGVGLVHNVKPAAAIVEEVHAGARTAFDRAAVVGLGSTSRPRL